ncbi:MAG: fructose-6-phosphate aldolase [Planctomycetota bacterium]
MKIFADTANVDELRKVAHIIDGVTTNPSLMAKENKKLDDLVNEICEIVDGPISVEAVSTKENDIINEARKLSLIHPNIVVKIPMTEEGIRAVKKLSLEDIKTNVTLVFSANQALLAAKAGATYVSPFIGRLDDIGQEGMTIIDDIMSIYFNYDFETQVIVASVRHPIHVLEAALIGAPVATVPFAVIQKMFTHSLTDVGIEKFLKDWEKVKK